MKEFYEKSEIFGSTNIFIEGKFTFNELKKDLCLRLCEDRTDVTSEKNDFYIVDSYIQSLDNDSKISLRKFFSTKKRSLFL